MRKTHLAAIKRSLDIYYRDAPRTARMDALNARFLPEGGLAFDLGAHVGDRTGSFLRLGARVVALEPQPHVFRALRLLYGRCPKASLHCAAVGAETGTLEMHVNSSNPTITTASQSLICAAQHATEWQGQVWDDRITVPVTTLDALIAEHGAPDFVKIDVEGFEATVLAGLSHALQALSFEFTTIQREDALACVDRLSRLGRHRYNLSLGEEHRLRHETWLDASALKAELRALPRTANSGDVFAERIA